MRLVDTLSIVIYSKSYVDCFLIILIPGSSSSLIVLSISLHSTVTGRIY